jgi:hypothetical protein
MGMLIKNDKMAINNHNIMGAKNVNALICENPIIKLTEVEMISWTI